MSADLTRQLGAVAAGAVPRPVRHVGHRARLRDGGAGGLAGRRLGTSGHRRPRRGRRHGRAVRAQRLRQHAPHRLGGRGPGLRSGRVVLVRQWRHGVREVGLEIPAGLGDPGETPEQAAARELVEETGYVAGSQTDETAGNRAGNTLVVNLPNGGELRARQTNDEYAASRAAIARGN